MEIDLFILRASVFINVERSCMKKTSTSSKDQQIGFGKLGTRLF